jgi:hypothetical protein
MAEETEAEDDDDDEHGCEVAGNERERRSAESENGLAKSEERSEPDMRRGGVSVATAARGEGTGEGPSGPVSDAKSESETWRAAR